MKINIVILYGLVFFNFFVFSVVAGFGFWKINRVSSQSNIAYQSAQDTHNKSYDNMEAVYNQCKKYTKEYTQTFLKFYTNDLIKAINKKDKDMKKKLADFVLDVAVAHDKQRDKKVDKKMRKLKRDMSGQRVYIH